MYSQNTFNNGKKYFLPLYAEHLRFLITRCGWTVAKIYLHFTFNKICLKKILSLVIMEKKFSKLMNNINFGYDCHNDFDNCFLAPVIDELEEMAYIRRYQSVFEKFC